MSEKGHSRTCSVRGVCNGRLAPELNDLTDRQRELLAATVKAWEASAPTPAHRPLLLNAGGSPGVHPNWPQDVPVPSRDELRALVHLDWLVADRSQAPDWVLS